MLYLYVALGGAIGAVLRFFTFNKISNIMASSFPYSATLIVNILGSFIAGLIVAVLARFLPGDVNFRVFLIVGIMGGFTTFSAFSLDVLKLIEQQNIAMASLYILTSVFFSIIAAFLGISLLKVI